MVLIAHALFNISLDEASDCLNEILGPEENEEYLERPSAKENEREAKERKEGEESLIKDT